MDTQTRVITTAVRTASLRSYIAAIRSAISAPDARFSEGLTTDQPCLGEQIRQQFLDSVHERISDAVPYVLRGQRSPSRLPWRKLDPDWQWEAKRLARKVNDRAVVRVQECPMEFRGRLSHRLRGVED